MTPLPMVIHVSTCECWSLNDMTGMIGIGEAHVAEIARATRARMF